MARPFTPDPDDTTGAGFTPWPVLDRSNEHDERVETFNWPGAANDYTIRLDMAILEQVGVTIEDTTTNEELFIVRWRDNPGPNEVAVHYDRGLARVHSSRDDNGGRITYKPLGVVVDAQFLATVQKALALSFADVAAVWGGISGTLSDQEDLQSALNGKSNTGHTHSIANISDLQDELDNLSGELAGKQNADGDLTALAALSSTGLIARTGSGTAAVRTLTGTSGEIVVTNGNGVSGNPTIAVDSNIPKKNAANTFTGVQVFNGGTGSSTREIYNSASSGDRLITINDTDIMCAATTGDCVLTLPALASVPMGFTVTFAHSNTGTGNDLVINTPSGSEYINGVTSFGTSFSYDDSNLTSIKLKKYDPVAWLVIR